MKSNSQSKFLIAGTSSGSGKTTISLGVIAALRKRGLSVSAFKCGPDYIDTGFHSTVSGNDASNLDIWMMSEEGVKGCFENQSFKSDCSIVEGVMGLFDGVEGESDFGSSAHVALTLDIPVILCVDCSGMARSVAAVVKGFTEFSRELNVVGVIANKVGSEYHADLLRNALKSCNLPPLIGYLKKDSDIELPERHLGLVPEAEKKQDNEFFSTLATLIEEQIDIDLLLGKTVSGTISKPKNKLVKKSKVKVRIGLARDEAFSFYYPDNLRILEDLGAEIVPFSPLHDKKLPKKLDMLYIGGGYPEIFAEGLSNNGSMRSEVKEFCDSNKFVYAECGGLMYLSSKLKNANGVSYSMCEALSSEVVMDNTLRRLGYREIKTINDSILGPQGTVIRGHEYHYSYLEKDVSIPNIYEVNYPQKPNLQAGGYLHNNILASYVHLYWGNREDIAESIIASVLKA